MLLSTATSCVLALLPVPAAALHREDRFDDDLVVEVLEGEASPTPGRHRFRYPELLLDRLALATFSSTKPSGSASRPASRSARARGGLLLGGPATDFAGSTMGIRCGSPGSQPSVNDGTNNGSNGSSTKAVLTLTQLSDLAKLVQSARSSRTAPSSRPARLANGAVASNTRTATSNNITSRASSDRVTPS